MRTYWRNIARASVNYNGGMRSVTTLRTGNYKNIHILSCLRTLHRRNFFTCSSFLTTEEMAKSVGESYNFPKEEEKVLELWKRIDAFRTALKLSEGKPRYIWFSPPSYTTLLFKIYNKIKIDPIKMHMYVVASSIIIATFWSSSKCQKCRIIFWMN